MKHHPLRKVCLACLLFIGFFFIAIASASAAVEISDGSVTGLYHFDNNFTDSSGKGRHGTPYGTYNFNTNFLSEALYLTTDGYVSVASSTVPFCDDEFTIGFWLKADSWSGWYQMGSNDTTLSQMYMNFAIYRAYATDWKPQFYFQLGGDGAGDNHIQYNAPSYDEDWHHFVLAFKPAVWQRMYRDGQLVASSGTIRDTCGNHGRSPRISNQIPLYIGAQNYYPYDPTGFFKGNIDEFFMKTGGLSDAQISALYNGGVGDVITTAPEGPLVYITYPPDEFVATSTPLTIEWHSIGFESVVYSIVAVITDTTSNNSWTQDSGLYYAGDGDGEFALYELQNGRCYSVMLNMIDIYGVPPEVMAVSETRNYCVGQTASYYGIPITSPMTINYSDYVPEVLQQMGIATPTKIWISLTSGFEKFLRPMRTLSGKIPQLNAASGTASGIDAASSTTGLMAYVLFAKEILPSLPISPIITILVIFFVIFAVFTAIRMIFLKR